VRVRIRVGLLLGLGLGLGLGLWIGLWLGLGLGLGLGFKFLTLVFFTSLVSFSCKMVERAVTAIVEIPGSILAAVVA
jgi:hypothetical protein